MPLIRFDWDNAGTDVDEDCRSHAADGDRGADLTYFDFERAIALFVDGTNLLARKDGTWIVMTLVHAAGGLEYAIERCKELGDYEFDTLERGNPKLKMRLQGGQLALSREDLDLAVQVDANEFFEAHREFVRKVRSYLLAHCPQLRQDYYWGYWFREEPREPDR